MHKIHMQTARCTWSYGVRYYEYKWMNVFSFLNKIKCFTLSSLSSAAFRFRMDARVTFKNFPFIRLSTVFNAFAILCSFSNKKTQWKQLLNGSFDKKSGKAFQLQLESNLLNIFTWATDITLALQKLTSDPYYAISSEFFAFNSPWCIKNIFYRNVLEFKKNIDEIWNLVSCHNT